MTHYEKVTREEIARRNYTEGTTRAYLRVLHDLTGYFQCPPEHLTPDQIREYTAHLVTDRKLSGNTVNQMVGALRFFYLTVLNKCGAATNCRIREEEHAPKPIIWSPDEVARLIDSAPTPFYRTILMTLYATGMRRAEVAALKLTDVDSARMVCSTFRRARAGRTAISCSVLICSRSCASTTAVCTVNRRCGCFPAAHITPPIHQSPKASSGTLAAGRPNAVA